jgi:hypothetical protein
VSCKKIHWNEWHAYSVGEFYPVPSRLNSWFAIIFLPIWTKFEIRKYNEKRITKSSVLMFPALSRIRQTL